MRPFTAVSTALNRTRAALGLLRTGTAWLAGRAVAGGRRVGSRAASLARGPLRTVLLGRRRATSVALVGLGALLAAVTARGVAATTGYPPLERRLGETWRGTGVPSGSSARTHRCRSPGNVTDTDYISPSVLTRFALYSVT